MTKYLDSKGLSYLWQKIKAELALKEGVHEHPYLGWVSDIKAEDAGKVVVFGTPEYNKDGVLTSLPTAVGHSLGRDVAGTSVFADEAYVRLGETTKIQLSTITETPEGGQSISYKAWDIPFATSDKIGVVRTGKADFKEPTGTDTTWHKAPIVDGYVWYENNDNSGLELTYTDGDGDYTGKKVIKLTDTNNASLSVQLDATPFIKDGMLESVQILKYTVTTTGEGEEAVTTKEWKTLEGAAVEGLINAPTAPGDDAIWMYFVWKTVHHDPNNVDTTLTTKTSSWLPATDLIKDCSADGERGIGATINSDGGNKFYVKTTEDGVLANANVSTGFNAEGKVVGYVDLSAYQKSADLIAFDKNDMDAIFEAAEADLAANNGVPTFPTKDPLVKEEQEEPAQPAE